MRFNYIARKERERIKKAIQEEINLSIQARYEAVGQEEKQAIFLHMAGLNYAIKIIERLDKNRG
jgi:hypothetical protein